VRIDDICRLAWGVARAIQNLLVKLPGIDALLIPQWQPFEEADRLLQGSQSTHCSMLLLAFERGYLPRLTSVLHRYLLKGDMVDPKVTEHYRNQLREHWLVRNTALKRHRESRSYLGKPMELFVAQHLEQSGFFITALEATFFFFASSISLAAFAMASFFTASMR
jgi:hypothetical protein